MAYKILFFLKKRCTVKEIGEKLRQTRESIGITIDEVAQDLKIRASQIEKIEQGNRDYFKDVFYQFHINHQ